MYIAFTEKGC